MTTTPDAHQLHALVARQQIAQVLATHSRGVDRADFPLLASAYHPDATVDYGFFNGAAHEFARILADAQKGTPVSLHRTSNIWIKVVGERAWSESYVIAYAEHATEAGAVQRLIGGRYLDRHSCREGVWRLDHRRYVMDWNTNRPSTAAWPEPPVDLGHFVPRGGQGAADAGRALLAAGAARFSHQGEHAMTAHPTADALDAALSRQAIHDLMMAYARGVDRADAELLASIFHDDATVISGVVNGSGAEFAAGITAFVRANLARSFHSVANEWIEVAGDKAVAESYVIASITAGDQDVMTGGRYVDAFERRAGVWKFTSRTFVMDWSSSQPASFQSDGMYAALTTRGCYGANDPVYAHWAAR